MLSVFWPLSDPAKHWIPASAGMTSQATDPRLRKDDEPCNGSGPRGDDGLVPSAAMATRAENPLLVFGAAIAQVMIVRRISSALPFPIPHFRSPCRVPTST